jgi:hypothetical protein
MDKDLSTNAGMALCNHAIRKKYRDGYPVGEPGKTVAALDMIPVMDTKGRSSSVIPIPPGYPGWNRKGSEKKWFVTPGNFRVKTGR